MRLSVFRLAPTMALMARESLLGLRVPRSGIAEIKPAASVPPAINAASESVTNRRNAWKSSAVKFAVSTP
jgi:hypothetical protein